MSDTVTSMSATRDRRRRRRSVHKATRVANTSQARAQKHRRRRRVVGPAIQATYRTFRILAPDMRVRYAHEVSGRSIDRTAWAGIVSRLIAQETGGNKTHFAQLVGVTYKTVLRWLAQDGDVSPERVAQVADACHMSPIELMLQVGYYRHADLPEPSPAQPADIEDEALRAIVEAGYPSRIKMRMIQRLTELRAEQRRRELDEVRWWIDQAKGA